LKIGLFWGGRISSDAQKPNISGAMPEHSDRGFKTHYGSSLFAYVVHFTAASTAVKRQ
jgi:hypothetical protein